MENKEDLLEHNKTFFQLSPEIIDIDDEDTNDDSLVKEAINHDAKCGTFAQPFNEKPTSLVNVKDDMVADLTCEFLEIAIQQVLYHRGLYPKEIFQLFKKYHVAIHMSIYPELTNYVSEILKLLKPLIKQDLVNKIVISISQNEKLFEEFVFELMSDRSPISKKDEQHLIDLEISLRECLLKLASYGAPPPEDPQSCSFEIKAHVERSSALQLLFNEEDNAKLQWVTEDTSQNITDKKLNPLKTIGNSPYLKMQMFVLIS